MAKLARLKHFFEGKRRLSTLDDYHQLKGRSGENRMKLFVSIPLSNGSLDGIPVEIAEEHALMERINSAVTFKKIAVEMKSATFSIFPTDAHKRPIISLPGTTVNGFRLVAQGSDDKRKVNLCVVAYLPWTDELHKWCAEHLHADWFVEIIASQMELEETDAPVVAKRGKGKSKTDQPALIQ